ncbi:exodeoxyribonuclease V, beta subunit, partial [Neisseria lactamica ATCC 23970]
MSASIQAFDPLTVPISGTNLIEASAGTGKTYGIAALFTRLIVLEQKSVERVLVVTFTKAATAELKHACAHVWTMCYSFRSKNCQTWRRHAFRRHCRLLRR